MDAAQISYLLRLAIWLHGPFQYTSTMEWHFPALRQRRLKKDNHLDKGEPHNPRKQNLYNSFS